MRKVADLSDAVSRSVEKEQELACITGAHIAHFQLTPFNATTFQLELINCFAGLLCHTHTHIHTKTQIHTYIYKVHHHGIIT